MGCHGRPCRRSRREAEQDAKTAFQEWAHARFGETPRYETVADSGTEDDERRFVAWRRAAPFGEVWAVLADGSACRVAVWGRGERPGELSERS